MAGRRVLLRIEDHDRQRSRPAFDAGILEDLDWLGFRADEGPVRQSDAGHVYTATLETLRFNGLVYACDCSRTTFAEWARRHDRPWSGGGCPGGCRDRRVAEGRGVGLRVALGGGEEQWTDLRLGPGGDAPDREGDLLVRDRAGNWTYQFCVVVDDARQEIDLVVRGEDLLGATAQQIRLGRLLGRSEPPTWYHHPLIRRPDGSKLSKSAGDSGVRELRAAGLSREIVIGRSAVAVGLLDRERALSATDVMTLVAFPDTGR